MAFDSAFPPVALRRTPPVTRPASLPHRNYGHDSSGNPYFLINRILDDRLNPTTNVYELLINWHGYDETENSWEPITSLQGTANTTLTTYIQHKPHLEAFKPRAPRSKPRAPKTPHHHNRNCNPTTSNHCHSDLNPLPDLPPPPPSNSPLDGSHPHCDIEIVEPCGPVINNNTIDSDIIHNNNNNLQHYDADNVEPSGPIINNSNSDNTIIHNNNNILNNSEPPPPPPEPPPSIPTPKPAYPNRDLIFAQFSPPPTSIPDLDPNEATSFPRPSYIAAALTLHVSSRPLARLSTPTKWSAALTASWTRHTEIFAPYLCNVLDLWLIHNDTTLLAQCILDFLSLPTRALLPNTNIAPVNANLVTILPNITPTHSIIGDIHKARPRPTTPPPPLRPLHVLEALPLPQSSSCSTMAKIA